MKTEKDYTRFKKVKVKTKVAIKPKKQPKPISFEKRKEIEELARKLPKLPNLIQLGDKLVIQEMKYSKLVSGEEILKKDPTATLPDGKSIDESKSYVNKGVAPRLLNHEVRLTEAYQQKGDAGMWEYVSYCKSLDEAINKQDKKEEPAKVEKTTKAE